MNKKESTIIVFLAIFLTVISSAFALSLNDISLGESNLFTRIFRSFFSIIPSVSPSISCSSCSSSSCTCAVSNCNSGDVLIYNNGGCLSFPMYDKEFSNGQITWVPGSGGDYSFIVACDVDESVSSCIPMTIQVENCLNGVDDDGDNKIDCLDEDCSSNPNSGCCPVGDLCELDCPEYCVCCEGACHENGYICGSTTTTIRPTTTTTVPTTTTQPSVTTTTPVCTDSDNGRNFYVKGTTYGVLQGQTKYWTDFCSGQYVVEYYCRKSVYPDSDPLQVETDYIECPNGCNGDGACIADSTTTTQQITSTTQPGSTTTTTTVPTTTTTTQPSVTTTIQPTTTTTIPPTTTTIPEGQFRVSSVHCSDEECTLNINTNTLNEQLVIFFEIVGEDDGRIYYSSNLNLESRSTGEKKLIISRLRSCPSGTRLELFALTYKQSNLGYRVNRVRDESFVC